MPIDACGPHFYDENMQVDSDGWVQYLIMSLCKIDH